MDPLSHVGGSHLENELMTLEFSWTILNEKLHVWPRSLSRRLVETGELFVGREGLVKDDFSHGLCECDLMRVQLCHDITQLNWLVQVLRALE